MYIIFFISFSLFALLFKHKESSVCVVVVFAHLILLQTFTGGVKSSKNGQKRNKSRQNPDTSWKKVKEVVKKFGIEIIRTRTCVYHTHLLYLFLSPPTLFFNLSHSFLFPCLIKVNIFTAFSRFGSTLDTTDTCKDLQQVQYACKESTHSIYTFCHTTHTRNIKKSVVRGIAAQQEKNPI